MWSHLYGELTYIPQGSAFMHWGASQWDLVLFSSRGGVFAWHPLCYLATAAVAFAVLAKKIEHPKTKALAIVLLAIFAAQTYINGAADDWWAGWSFGGRRFVAAVPLFCLGTTIMTHGTWSLAR